MPAEPTLEHLFPTTILIADHPDAGRLNAALLEIVVATRNADPEGRKRSNVQAWQSDRLDRSAQPIQEFCRFVLDHGMQFARAHQWNVDGAVTLVMPELWVNVNGPNSFNQLHTHPNSLISGVYYAKTPADSGELILHDPRKQASVYQAPLSGRNFRNVHQYQVEPKEGRLVLFPSWLEHGVGQNRSEEERVSFSFNIDQSLGG